MKRKISRVLWALPFFMALGEANGQVKIVSSLPDFASIAESVGGERVEVTSIAKGYQDAHFVKAKPSFARQMSEADLFLTTGMDLELWVPTLIDKSRNRDIREGESGYVNVSQGMTFLEVPASANRAAGDTHIYGNPHISTDPLRGIQIAENILAGLKRVDPSNGSYYEKNFQDFRAEVYRRLYGEELVRLVGAEQLGQLSRNQRLAEFLDANQFGGKPLKDYLEGWVKISECLQGKQIIAYHKNWIYFTDRFGLEIVDYVEHKPGIPPSARHQVELIRKIQSLDIRAILTANYFDEKAPRMLEERTGAKALIVPLSVGGTPEAGTYLDLFDIWIQALVSVFPDCR